MTQYAVIGGELTNVNEQEFRDPSKVTFHGIFNDEDEAHKVWKRLSQSNVDNALMRFVVATIW